MVWATNVDNTRKMTDFRSNPFRVSAAFGGLCRSRSVLGQHLYRQKNRIEKNAHET